MTDYVQCLTFLLYLTQQIKLIFQLLYFIKIFLILRYQKRTDKFKSLRKPKFEFFVILLKMFFVSFIFNLKLFYRRMKTSDFGLQPIKIISKLTPVQYSIRLMSKQIKIILILIIQKLTYLFYRKEKKLKRKENYKCDNLNVLYIYICNVYPREKE